MWSLFLSSYTPLFVLLAIRSVGREGAAPVMIASATLVLLGAAGTLALLTVVDQKGAGTYELLDVENRDADVASYAATYVLPFVTELSGGWRDLISLGAFVLFLGAIYVRSRLIYVNPTLFLLGWHLWRVVAQTPGAKSPTVAWPRFLLADTRTLAPGMTVSARRLSDDLLLIDKIRKAP